MGSSNSVPAEMQGHYSETKTVKLEELKSIDYTCKLMLKEQEFELNISSTECTRKPESEGFGGTFKTGEHCLLLGKVEEHGDASKGEEITINFKTSNASYTKGMETMGVPMPNDEYKSDFVMKYAKITNERGTFNSLTFVTHPKLRFEELSGTLMGKKCN